MDSPEANGTGMAWTTGCMPTCWVRRGPPVSGLRRLAEICRHVKHQTADLRKRPVAVGMLNLLEATRLGCPHSGSEVPAGKVARAQRD